MISGKGGSVISGAPLLEPGSSGRAVWVWCPQIPVELWNAGDEGLLPSYDEHPLY